MAIVFPAERIAQHWNGALEASLRRAPLEEFLRLHALQVAPRGATRNSDDISRATLFIMTLVLRGRTGEKNTLISKQRAIIGQSACCICHSLAALIGEPRSWRVAALASTGQLISPGLSLFAAASAAAAAAQEYTNRSTGAASLRHLTTLASAAVSRNSAVVLQQLVGHLSDRFDSMRSATEQPATCFESMIGS